METKFCPLFFYPFLCFSPPSFLCYNRAMNDIELKDYERVNQLFSSDVKSFKQRGF